MSLRHPVSHDMSLLSFKEVHDSHGFLEFQVTIWWSSGWLKVFAVHFQKQQSSSTLSVLQKLPFFKIIYASFKQDTL